MPEEELELDSSDFSFHKLLRGMQYSELADIKTKDVTQGTFNYLSDERQKLEGRLDALQISRERLDEGTIQQAVHWQPRVGRTHCFHTSLQLLRSQSSET